MDRWLVVAYKVQHDREENEAGRQHPIKKYVELVLWRLVAEEPADARHIVTGEAGISIWKLQVRQDTAVKQLYLNVVERRAN